MEDNKNEKKKSNRKKNQGQMCEQIQGMKSKKK